MLIIAAAYFSHSSEFASWNSEIHDLDGSEAGTWVGHKAGDHRGMLSVIINPEVYN